MFSTVMSTMFWFQTSHEFYGLYKGHGHSSPIKQDTGRWNTLHLGVGALIAACYISIKWSMGATQVLVMDIVVTNFMVYISIGVVACWHLENDFVPRRLDCEGVYLLISVAIACVAVWFDHGDDGNTTLYMVRTFFDIGNLLLQTYIVIKKLNMNSICRIIIVYMMFVEFSDAMVREILHYTHMLHDEDKSIGNVILTLLSWSVLDSYLAIITGHLGSLFYSEYDDLSMPLNGYE